MNTISAEQRTRTEKSDAELVSMFQQGNVAGFNELVRRYREKVYWITRRIVVDHDDADDVTQEVFVKVFNAVKNFRFESEFYTWIYRIATNLSLNHLRSKKVKQFFRLDDESNESQSNEIKDEALLPNEQLEQKELKTMIEKAVETLPKQQRATFIMRHYDELSYEEIAEKLDLPLGTVKAQLFRAKDMLYNTLKVTKEKY